MALPGLVGYTLSNVHNASDPGTSYARLTTYPTADGSGPTSNEGGIAYAYNPRFNVTTTVPPFIELCVAVDIVGTDCAQTTGSYVDLGEFTHLRPSAGRTQMVISTNADFGYVIAVGGHTMTAGNNIIPNLTSPTVSIPGTSQFGINLRSNNNPDIGDDPSGTGSGQPTANYNQADQFAYNQGDIVASFNDVEDHRKYTVSYLVNINRNQAAGVYSSTFTYTALGNF
jgi:hypothetical protein